LTKREVARQKRYKMPAFEVQGELGTCNLLHGNRIAVLRKLSAIHNALDQ
jgi:hypothetical protein